MQIKVKAQRYPRAGYEDREVVVNKFKIEDVQGVRVARVHMSMSLLKIAIRDTSMFQLKELWMYQWISSWGLGTLIN